jgi:hypothetical protein
VANDRIVMPGQFTVTSRIDALEQQVEALQRHRFAVSVFLGLGLRKRFLWLLFGAKVFRPSQRDAKPEVSSSVSL